MEIQNNPLATENSQGLEVTGTLAIDLGSSTTVVAFKPINEKSIQLLDLSPITRFPGEVPSLIWQSPQDCKSYLYGHEVDKLNHLEKQAPYLISDFKRWIGAPKETIIINHQLLPEEAGELLIKKIWKELPNHLKVTRLVLTAPIETYKSYRKWLYQVCSELDVEEIALVDEPTAAAIGAGQKGGSKLLVIDIGGSTIDMSMVEIEGGEGKADPIAQLIRFNGKDLEGKSKQVLRCAKVLGKQGLRLGGRDFDRWIANYLYPGIEQNELLLNATEILKCKLSNINIPDTKNLVQESVVNNEEKITLKLNRILLEEILKNNGLITILQKLLEQTLARGSSNGCELEDLTGVVLVGGGSRIPIIRRWLEKKIHPIKLLTPPPIEAVATGALMLTPGVTIKDLLTKGVSLRCWNQKNNSYSWHPIFLPGQPWPTSNPLEIILATSKDNQDQIDLQIADYDISNIQEIIYINGIPTIKDEESKPRHILWTENVRSIKLNPPGKSGEDCLKLFFRIDSFCKLLVKGIDVRSGEVLLLEEELGLIR